MVGTSGSPTARGRAPLVAPPAGGATAKTAVRARAPKMRARALVVGRMHRRHYATWGRERVDADPDGGRARHRDRSMTESVSWSPPARCHSAPLFESGLASVVSG